MALDKVTYTDNVTHIPASNLNAIQDEINSNSSRITALERGNEIYYGTCSTSSATTKDVIVQAGASFVLRTGTTILVKFSYSAYAGSSTLYLRVNSGASKAIYKGAGATDVHWSADQTVLFVYDGTYWQQVT